MKGKYKNKYMSASNSYGKPPKIDIDYVIKNPDRFETVEFVDYMYNRMTGKNLPYNDAEDCLRICRILLCLFRHPIIVRKDKEGFLKFCDRMREVSRDLHV